MIKGIGMDITQISRIEKLMTNPHFIERVLTDHEKILLDQKPKKSQWVAARFATKEAVAKAFGVGISKCPLNEVETIYDELGAPKIRLYDQAKQLMENIDGQHIHISITHEDDYAAAVAIIE